MKRPFAALLALGTAACNGQGGDANRAAAGAAPAAAVTTPLQPGRWEMTMRVVSMELPNASPEIAAQARAQPLPPQQIIYNCISPQDAANPVQALRQQLIRDQPNLSCDPTTQQFADGQIRIVLECRGLNGQPDERMAMAGTFTTTNMQAAVSTTTSTPIAGAMQPVQVENTLTGRRVGECNGTETE